MSGTSQDGVDAALCRIRGTGSSLNAELLAFETVSYGRSLRDRLRSLAEGEGTPASLARADVEVGEAFARAALQVTAAVGRKRRPDFVASHGQTVWHEPRRGRRSTATLQIGCAAVIAERLGCPVVSDFRSRDAAAGGQGAPLVPYADWALLRAKGRVRAVQNLGGVGNVSVVTGRLRDVFAFDTGPANLPLDEAARLVSGGRERFDGNGRRARRGRVDSGAVKALLRHPFLRRKPPRSTGREEFGAAFVTETARRHRLSGDDLVATLTDWVARATREAYRRFVEPRQAVDEVLLCGGGARNGTLVERLREQFAPVPVGLLDDAGLPSDAHEALAFAVLGAETLRGVPTGLPAVTGARRAVVLGTVTP
jgi:anhydro-N-acetylmuramic acid kinase